MQPHTRDTTSNVLSKGQTTQPELSNATGGRTLAITLQLTSYEPWKSYIQMPMPRHFLNNLGRSVQTDNILDRKSAYGC